MPDDCDIETLPQFLAFLACPKNFRLASSHNCVSQFLKITLCLRHHIGSVSLENLNKNSMDSRIVTRNVNGLK